MIDHLAALSIEEDLLQFRDERTLGTYLESLAGVAVTQTGSSREDRALYGLRFGRGSRAVSIIAGCHADEPIGPMTAQALPRILSRAFPELLERYVFHVVPQMNPDGAERNRPWFSDPPKLSAYLEHATRELPGDDIEFGFGAGEDVRPECRAAQEFLRSAAPFTAHFSLHGMAFAEGAWCLMNPEWADRAGTFMDSLSGLCSELDVPMHDVDRKGEKGFTRLREGFSTTPNSVAMKRFFVERGDVATASLFMPSSMEWIRSLGGDPLCIVTELPLFLIGKRSPSLSEAISNELREDLSQLRAMRGEERSERMTELTRTYDLRPMPLDLQVRLQVAMIVLGLHLTESPS